MVNARVGINILLATVGALLCWYAVAWELRPGLFPILDELGTKAIVSFVSYRQILNFFPNRFYADRPLGWAFIRLVNDWFGFNYRAQAACLLVVHFANCALAFRLFRCLGLTLPLTIAGISLYGSLWTTAQTATYIGEAFDIVCLFFLLGSVLAILSKTRGASVLSAILFLAALRSKEFAIVAPLLLTILVALRLPRMPLPTVVTALLRRLWLHYTIVLVFGIRYAFLFREDHGTLAPDSAYRMDWHLSTVLQSLSYYTTLIFGADGSLRKMQPILLALAFGAVLGLALFRRNAGMAFGVAGYVLTALPVFLMPYTRAVFWMYGPQLFLILAMSLLLKEAFAAAMVSGNKRWVGSVCVAIVVLSWCIAFRRSTYFRNRVHWVLDVRRASAQTVAGANLLLPHLSAGTTLFVRHPPDSTPWLFVPGPCSFFQIVNRQESITCVWNEQPTRMRALYEHASAPKYLIDYRLDGSITVSEWSPD